MRLRFKTIMTAVVAMITVGFLSVPVDAEAKRLGGGMNLGKQSSGMQRQAQPPAQAQRPAQQGQAQQAAPGQGAAAASGASRWLGPLAGLAAGGLLASMFFGDAFDGFQIMDFLLIALLAFGGFMLFRMWRRNQAKPGMVPAGVGGGFPPSPPVATYERREQTPSAPFGGRPDSGILHPGVGDQAGPVAGDNDAPAWFDGSGFLEGSKTHFIRLQAAWDQADFRDIREYTTPQLFADLQRERQKSEGTQYTEVVRLNTEMIGVRRDEDLVVASILFSGLIREDEKGVAEDFREIWHVQHRWDGPEGDWLIAGIQQVQA
jgi:predicted lipid-binding transport protein (Tim44 family)